MALVSLLTGGFKGLLGEVDEYHFSAEEKATLKAKLSALEINLSREALQLQSQLIKSRGDIILAEAKANWYTASWRPTLMYLFILILANNFVIGPYLESIFPSIIVTLDFPDKFWTLLTVAVGGYIAGRSGEQVVEKWKKD